MALTRFQSLFVLVGIALVIAGLSTSTPLAIAGAALIGLAVMGRCRGV